MPAHERRVQGQVGARPDSRARKLRPGLGGHEERTYHMFIGIGTIVVIVIIVLVVLALRR
jgi:Bacterial aa3 type cytochrome c oxidase subunit IV